MSILIVYKYWKEFEYYIYKNKISFYMHINTGYMEI